MIKTVFLNFEELEYELEYKKVKNINLRIRNDGSIYVSANKYVSQKRIEEFILSKSDFILNAVKAAKSRELLPPEKHCSEEELPSLIIEFCRKVYPYYQKLGIPFPQIKFRRMVSRWGSCHPAKGILTFNTALIYAPIECIEYVVWHEFTHFLHPDHSKRFYAELEKVCPDWKSSRQLLKGINIRKGDLNS